MTLIKERTKKKRALKKSRKPSQCIPLTPTLKKLVAETDANPDRKLTIAERLELYRWMKADLADAAQKAGLK